MLAYYSNWNRKGNKKNNTKGWKRKDIFFQKAVFFSVSRPSSWFFRRRALPVRRRRHAGVLPEEAGKGRGFLSADKKLK